MGVSQSCLFVTFLEKNLVLSDLNCLFFFILFEALGTTVLTVKVFTLWGFTACSLRHALWQALLTLTLVKQRISGCKRVTDRDKKMRTYFWTERNVMKPRHRADPENDSTSSQRHDLLSGWSELEDERVCVQWTIDVFVCVCAILRLSLQRGHKPQLGEWVTGVKGRWRGPGCGKAQSRQVCVGFGR